MGKNTKPFGLKRSDYRRPYHFVGTRKKIGGKTYEVDSAMQYKGRAKTEAKRLRKKGKSVRVLRVGRGKYKYWGIFVSKR